MRLALLGLLLVLAASAAAADSFTSPEFRFSAEFPSAPKILASGVDGERNANGAVISKITAFGAGRKGAYAATVTVEIYQQSTRLDAQRALNTERDSFLRTNQTQLTSSAAISMGGHPALHFSFDSGPAALKGQGLVVVIEGEAPRMYMVIAEYTGNASADEIAALDRFVKSFQLAG